MMNNYDGKISQWETDYLRGNSEVSGELCISLIGIVPNCLKDYENEAGKWVS